MSTNSWSKMANAKASRDGSTLVLKFEMPAHENIPVYYYTVNIDLRNTSIYSGYWMSSRDQYGRSIYLHSGDKTVIDFKGTVTYSADIPAYTTNNPTTRSLRIFQIRCSTEADADKLVSCFLAAQKGYREPDAWEVYRNKQTEISNNPYSGSSSKDLFNKIKSILTEYSIQAKLGSYTNADIKNMKVQFVYPNLKFSFTTTKASDDPFMTSSDKFGKVELSCPFESTTVENSYGTVVFSSSKGLDYRFNDKHTIIGDYAFKMSSFLSEDFTAAVQQFFKAVKSENFQGSYGVTTQSSSSAASATLPNKYNGSRYSISYPNGWSYLENVQGADVYIGANDGSIAFTILSFSTPYSLDEVMEEANSNAARAGWKKTNTSTTLCGVKCYKSRWKQRRNYCGGIS